ALRYKANLPNYGVFDEKRLFARGPAAGPVTVKGVRVGVPICEDIWLEESEEYENIVECLAETGAEILVVPNGSPYARDKNDVRLSVAGARVTESGLPLVEGDKGDYAACVLGLRDYVRKNGFPGILPGVSGGIASALCAAIAVDALGADKLRGVMLPFRFTAQVSLDDAAKLAKALGFPY